MLYMDDRWNNGDKELWLVQGLQAVGAATTIGLIRPLNRRPVVRVVVAGFTMATQALVEKDKQVFRARAADQLLQATAPNHHNNNNNNNVIVENDERNHIRHQALAYLGQQLGLDTPTGRADMEYVMATNYSPPSIRFKAAVYGLTLGYFGILYEGIRVLVPTKGGGIIKGPTLTLHEWYSQLVTGIPPYRHNTTGTTDEAALLEWSIGRASEKFLPTTNQEDDPRNHNPEFWHRRGPDKPDLLSFQ